MTVVCRSCSRVNPSEAHYCYHDGVALGSAVHQAGPLSIGSQPFHSAFVFPSGRACRNFDELVLACDSEWSEARELLQQGYLEGFLGGLGRADLALAARQAAKATDPDRGLEEFLGKLPGKREPAKLLAQPLEVSLGQVRRDEERHFVLHLENQGMGLLYGSVATDQTAWLVLGDGAGSPRKVFQGRHDMTIPVHVVGKALRAGEKAQEGRLVIESNGGTFPVLVRAEVPIQPFPDGALAGARTPRQVAEKAKANPKEAAVLFEKGAVAAWYETNGWTYPVQGPASSGLGAVQQFFEALGLVKPPKVEISTQAVELHGAVGAALEHVIQVHTVEKRPVYANATSGVPWLKVGRVHLGGRTARIPLIVPSVPALPGERLQGQVHVTSNGNQRFTVDVILAVSGAVPQAAASVAVVNMDQVMAGAPPLPRAFHAAGGGAGPVVTVEPEAFEVLPLVEPTVPEVFPVAVPLDDRMTGGRPAPPPGLPPLPPLPPRGSVRATPPPLTRPERRATDDESSASTGPLKHLAPLAVLLLGLLGMVVHDFALPNEGAVKEEKEKDLPALISTEPLLAISFADGSDLAPPDGRPKPPPTMRFGLEMLLVPDPDQSGKFKRLSEVKRLTYDRWGRTNNTCVRVDMQDTLFGLASPDAYPPGRNARWVKREEPLGKDGDRERIGKRSVWLLDDKIEVTQTVELVPGGQSRLLDTCLIRYTLVNKDTRPHQVGLRFLLDTFIGANDGVPFNIGRGQLCDTMAAFGAGERLAVPDYIQALEKDDLKNPGTVAHLQFRMGNGLEEPSRVTLGGWPDPDLARFGWKPARGALTLWDVPVLPMDTLHRLAPRIRKTAKPDSAVTVYWNPKSLGAGKRRDVGFTYGLGQVESTEGKLLLTTDSNVTQGAEFTLTALVRNPRPGEKLTLTLPSGFQLAGGRTEQVVPPLKADAARPISAVTWHVKAGRRGNYTLKVQSSAGTSQEKAIRIGPPPRGVLD